MRRVLVFSALISVLLFGCCEPYHAPAPAPAKAAPKPMPKPAKAPATGMTLPCDECGIVRIEKLMPDEVMVNTPFEYTIRVTNLTDMTLSQVEVIENLADNFKFDSATPDAKVDGNKLMWVMKTFAPDSFEDIKVRGMATSTDYLKHCATVTYLLPSCSGVNVVEPKLMIAQKAPAEVMLCDPIPVTITVKNTGTGDAKNVKVTQKLPAGLMTAGGKTSVTLDAGTLSGGESREFKMMLKASKTGAYVNKAMAMSSNGLEAASADVKTTVRQPVLTIAKKGPSKIYLTQKATYEITVSNKGDAVAKELMVEDMLPGGANFVSASDGGKLMDTKVVWPAMSLSPNQSKTMTVTILPTKMGTVTDKVAATAICADAVSATAKTKVAGIPAVLLEVIDIEDPIPVGGNVTYVITATNQGSLSGTNIKIDCELEDTMAYVTSSGATVGSADGMKVSFAPLASLAPKAKATWRVTVKSVDAGDVRFTVKMNTDQITRPVQENEATTFYK